MENDTCTVDAIVVRFVALVTVATVASCYVHTLLFTCVFVGRLTFIHIYRNF